MARYKRTGVGFRKQYRRRKPGVPRRKFRGRLTRGTGLVQTFSRWVEYADLASNQVANTNAAYNFKLSDLPSFSEFTNLYDQYMITRVSVKLLPTVNVNQVGAANITANPLVAHVIDYDDATPLTTFQDYFQYNNCKTTMGIKPIFRSFRPHLAAAVYGSGAFTSYSNRKSCWLDVASTSVEHYGFKIIVGATGAGTNAVDYKVLVRYTMKFRATR